MKALFKEITDSKLFKFFDEHITLSIAMISALVAGGSFAIQLCEYALCLGRTSVYNIPKEYIDINNNNFIFDFVFRSLIFLGLITCVFLINRFESFLRSAITSIVIKTAYTKRTELIEIIKNKWPSILDNVFIVLLAGAINLIITVVTTSGSVKMSNTSISIGIVFLLLIELLTVIFLKPKKIKWVHKKQEKEKQENLGNVSLISIRLSEDNKSLLGIFNSKIKLALFSTAVLIIIVVASCYGLGHLEAKSANDYEFINKEQQVIIYKFNDKYLIAKAEINRNKLTIHTDVQTIIDFTCVEVTKENFKNVEIKP